MCLLYAAPGVSKELPEYYFYDCRTIYKSLTSGIHPFLSIFIIAYLDTVVNNYFCYLGIYKYEYI